MTGAIDFYYDFVDPLSYLLALELQVARSAADPPLSAPVLQWLPLELSPPPQPLIATSDPSMADRWSDAGTVAERLGITFGPPDLVPWTRKAHELMLHADASGAAEDLRMRTFEAWLVEGRDIGRVDVLVELARTVSLDVSEAKAVLDVDRYEARVGELRTTAAAGGVHSTPTLVYGASRLEGFHNRTALGTFLGT